MTTSKPTQHLDVVIVGGGMVGLSLACTLAQLPLKIALIENHSPVDGLQNSQPDDVNSFDLRVSAITRASQQLFESIGAWENMQEMGICPFTDMHVWDAGGDGSIHFDSAEIGQSCLGHIAENRVIQTALLNQARSRPNIQIYCPDKISALTIDPENHDPVQLRTDNGIEIHAQLIVGADGNRSWLKQFLSIESQMTEYHQKAIVCTVATEKPNLLTAWQRFLPSGPLAFLPLSEKISSIVWSNNEEQGDNLLSLTDSQFSEALQQAFDQRLGKILQVSKRADFPLKAHHAKHYVQAHAALVGDAAHTIHPLAGQGVNLGIADVAALTEILKRATENGIPIGRLSTLRRYERWRRGDNSIMMSVMTAFKNLFSNESPVLTPLRNLGLNITDSATPVKNLIIEHAMGLRGDYAPLAKVKPFEHTPRQK